MIQLNPKLIPRSPVYIDARTNDSTSWLEIDLARIDHNVACFRNILNRPDRFSDRQPFLCGVIKSNAYGLGAVALAQRLVTQGVDMLAVYSPQQAEQLVKNAVKCPLLLLMPLRKMSRSHALYRAAVAGQLHLTIHDRQQIEQINQFSQMLGMKAPVHLYFDTGMSRSGLNEQTMIDVLARLPDLPHIQLEGIYTHLASAASNETLAGEQANRFDRFLKKHSSLIPPDTLIHVANTYAALRDRQYHRDMVRIGLGFFGYGPDLLHGGNIVPDIEQLQPAVRWVSRVVHTARYPKHTCVGYDASYKLWRDSVLGVVPVGYGDGYPLSLGNKGCVGVPQHRSGPDHLTANVLGKINMDQVVIDLTDIANALDNKGRRRTDDNHDLLTALLDMEVELVSDDPTSPCSLPRVAQTAGTSCYELLCRFNASIPRHYVTSQTRAVNAAAVRHAD